MQKQLPRNPRQLAFAILHEPFTVKSLVGCVLIGAGTLFMVL